MKHLTKISDLTREEILQIIEQAKDVKENPSRYKTALEEKTLLMFFEKPSLRTRISFEVGMTQLGGHAIYYNISTSPLGIKENIHDTAKCISRYCDFILARVNRQETINDLKSFADVPVLNGLDDFAHPTQIISDMFTIKEKLKVEYDQLKLAYFGDLKNNVTYDIMRACAILGIQCSVSGPNINEYHVEKRVWDEIDELNKMYNSPKIKYFEDPKEAAKDVDIIYTDSWMSYGIPIQIKHQRETIFNKYKVTKDLLKCAKKNVIFMNCLPANRNEEQTSEVVDGIHSIVFDQAENRLYAQKSILLFLSEHTKKSPKMKIHISIGGNALIESHEEMNYENMMKNVKSCTKDIAELVKQGHSISISHGNGPQVGALVLQNQSTESVSAMPLSVLGAQSQGEIGYLIQQSLSNHLKNTDITPVTMITQVEVDKNDKAFSNPTKPIGKFYTKEQSEKLEKQGKIMKEVSSGKGFRVVVPSPKPIGIIESKVMKKTPNDQILIIGGGGGIPVYKNEEGNYSGIDCVIDKDYVSAMIAKERNVDLFVIVTNVDYVSLNFKKDNESFLKDRINLKKAQ
eukprot:gene11507-4671_t